MNNCNLTDILLLLYSVALSLIAITKYLTEENILT